MAGGFMKTLFVVLAAHLFIQSFEWTASTLSFDVIPVAAAEEESESGNVKFFNCGNSIVTRMVITGCFESTPICRLKNGNFSDFIVEFMPEKDYSEVQLSIDILSPLSFPLISHEKVCGTNISCPLVKGQKAVLHRKDFQLMVPFFVPQDFLEFIEMKATIYEDKSDEIISCVLFTLSVDKE